jgi:hypothetical protein
VLGTGGLALGSFGCGGARPGILLGLIGTDVNSGVIRFAFGAPELADGLGFVALAMAFFGITDVVLNLERDEKQEVFTSRIGRVRPRGGPAHPLVDHAAPSWLAARHCRAAAARPVRRLHAEKKFAPRALGGRHPAIRAGIRQPPARRPRSFQC